MSESVLRASRAEVLTTKEIIYGLLKTQSMTMDELVQTLFSEPYSLDSSFGLKYALEAISQALDILYSQLCLVPVFEKNIAEIKIETKWRA